MFGNEIPSPSDDPQLRELRKQQQQAHEQIQKNSEVVQAFKAKREAAQNVLGPQGSGRHQITPDETARARSASRAVRAARQQLRDLDKPLREARAAAAKRIVAEIRPEYLARVGAYARAYLHAREAELVALENVLALRRDLAARQISMSGLPLPPFSRNLEKVEWDQQVVKEDARAMIEAGVLRAGDLPKELRKIWRL